MIIALGSDHAGFEYKEEIKKHLVELGHDVLDKGTFSKERANYAEYGIRAAEEVGSGRADLGVLVCYSGEGISIAANKVNGVRAGIGYNDEVAALLRQHNNANIIAFGQNFMKLEDVLRRIDIFLEARFEEGRHTQRVNYMSDYENK